MKKLSTETETLMKEIAETIKGLSEENIFHQALKALQGKYSEEIQAIAIGHILEVLDEHAKRPISAREIIQAIDHKEDNPELIVNLREKTGRIEAFLDFAENLRFLQKQCRVFE